MDSGYQELLSNFVKCLETRLLGLVMHNLCTYCTLYYVCEITSGCSWGEAAEEDAIGEQQLKQMQSGSSS